MDKALLVKEQIEDGEKLIRALDKTNFNVTSALWFYFPSPNEWRLIIASPTVDSTGPTKALTLIQTEINNIASPPLSIRLWNVAVVSPQDRLISLLKVAIRTGPAPNINGIWFTQNVINNVLIEDAYIYRNT